MERQDRIDWEKARKEQEGQPLKEEPERKVTGEEHASKEYLEWTKKQYEGEKKGTV